MTENRNRNKREPRHPAKQLKSLIENTIIIGLIGFFWASFFSFRDRILTTYESLAHDVETCIFSYEILYTLCNQMNKTVDATPNCKYLKEMDLFKIRQSLASQFSDAFKNMDSLGKMMAVESYRELHNFNSWSNTVIAKEQICKGNLLVSYEKMDLWRDQILTQLSNDREQHKKILVSLKYYFLYLFTDIEAERHKPFKVNLYKLPIYLNNDSTKPIN